MLGTAVGQDLAGLRLDNGDFQLEDVARDRRALWDTCNDRRRSFFGVPMDDDEFRGGKRLACNRRVPPPARDNHAVDAHEHHRMRIGRRLVFRRRRTAEHASRHEIVREFAITFGGATFHCIVEDCLPWLRLPNTPIWKAMATKHASRDAAQMAMVFMRSSAISAQIAKWAARATEAIHFARSNLST